MIGWMPLNLSDRRFFSIFSLLKNFTLFKRFICRSFYIILLLLLLSLYKKQNKQQLFSSTKKEKTTTSFMQFNFVEILVCLYVNCHPNCNKLSMKLRYFFLSCTTIAIHLYLSGCHGCCMRQKLLL